MKKIIALMAFAITTTVCSQSLGYDDLGVLLSKDDNYGTARFEAMSGAFGALGGDLSSTGINPAGASVVSTSLLSITAGNRNTDLKTTYYGSNTNSQDDYFNLSQAGGVLVFDSAHNSNWNRFALTFNYRKKVDFNRAFSVKGNSGKALFNEHPNDTSNPINQYNNAQEQRFLSNEEGQSSVFNFGFSSAFQNKLYVGASLNVHSFQLNQTTRLNEVNKDASGNTLTAFNEQINAFNGSGVSFSLGFIYKAHQNFRFGLAYETPTWYQEVIEETNMAVFDPNNNRYNDWLGFTKISATNIGTDIDSGQEVSTYEYTLKAPSRITASTAFIFDKKGLLSIDYTYKNYAKMKYENGSFDALNKDLANGFVGTHAFNIGTEWRFDRMSVRGGYHYEQSPYKNAYKEDNLKGFSLGLGYNFGNTKFDLAYRRSTSNSPYQIYNSDNIGSVNPIEIKNNTSRITGTLTFNL